MKKNKYLKIFVKLKWHPTKRTLGWDAHSDDFNCHHPMMGPAPKDQIIIVVFLIFLVAAITTYQYHDRNRDAYKIMTDNKT